MASPTVNPLTDLQGVFIFDHNAFHESHLIIGCNFALIFDVLIDTLSSNISKKVFFPHPCVRPWFHVIDILEYVCRISRDVFGAVETRAHLDLEEKSDF